jgi:hypothetical protein
MHRISGYVFVGLMLAASAIGAQPPEAQPGARARLVVDGRERRELYEGTIVRVVTDTVVLRYPSTNFGAPTMLTVSRTSLADFQISAGAPRKKYAVRGAIVGALLGGLLGAVTAPHYMYDTTPPGDFGPERDHRGLRMAIGAAGGALLVGYFSALAAPERWVTVQ